MAAKSRLISFSQILASKILLLFVPTSANSFSIWGVEMLATYGLTIWGLQDSRWLKVGTTLASSELIRPWQGSPVFVGQHRWSQYSQWSRPATKACQWHPIKCSKPTSLIVYYLDSTYFLNCRFVFLNREISSKSHLAREIDNVPVNKNSAASRISRVQPKDARPPSCLKNTITEHRTQKRLKRYTREDSWISRVKTTDALSCLKNTITDGGSTAPL